MVKIKKPSTQNFYFGREFRLNNERNRYRYNNLSQYHFFAELWARSRKNSFLFPGIQKTFRAKLLELVENGRGKRIRTDIDGFASVEKLSVGQHFVIGTASLGKVGVTWSTPVILKPGINKLSLTLQNSVWSL